MDAIEARQSLAELTLQRNFPDQPPHSDDEDFLEWVREYHDSDTRPALFTAPPSFLLNLFLNGSRYLKYGDGLPTVISVRHPPLDQVTAVPEFVSDDASREELQSMLDEHIRGREVIEQPMPHEMPHDVRKYITEADYSPTVPPQADPTLYRNGIVFDEVNFAVFLTPGNLAELLTDARTVAGYDNRPVHIRISTRTDTLQKLMSEPGKQITPTPSRYTPQ